MSLAEHQTEPLTLDQLTDSAVFQTESPCIALFGEFSAGKSSLANLLAGTDILPTSVLSSTRRLSRLCYAESTQITAVNDEQERLTIALNEVSSQVGGEFREIEICVPCSRLRHLEILDTPGFADPYHGPQRTLDAAEQADLGIWCTRASQAWRHSEWAAWMSLPQRLHRTGLLVVTRCDSLANETDRQALFNRLRHEAGGMFGGIVMLSIPDARHAHDAATGALDAVLWQRSGGKALAVELLKSLEQIAADRRRNAPDIPRHPQPRHLQMNETSNDDGTALCRVADQNDETILVRKPSPLSGIAAHSADPKPDQADTGVQPTDFADVLHKMMQAMPTCRFMAYVDLESARPLAVTVRGQTETPLGMDDRLAALAVHLLVGPASESMQRLTRPYVKVESEAADVIREITIESSRNHYVFIRCNDLSNQALIVVNGNEQPSSQTLATSRMMLAQLIEQQDRANHD